MKYERLNYYESTTLNYFYKEYFLVRFLLLVKTQAHVLPLKEAQWRGLKN